MLGWTLCRAFKFAFVDIFHSLFYRLNRDIVLFVATWSLCHVFKKEEDVTILFNTAWSPSVLVRIDHELNCVDLLSQELQSLYKAVVLVI